MAAGHPWSLQFLSFVQCTLPEQAEGFNGFLIFLVGSKLVLKRTEPVNKFVMLHTLVPSSALH